MDLNRRTIQIEISSLWDDPADWIADLIESKLEESEGEELVSISTWNTIVNGKQVTCDPELWKD